MSNPYPSTSERMYGPRQGGVLVNDRTEWLPEGYSWGRRKADKPEPGFERYTPTASPEAVAGFTQAFEARKADALARAKARRASVASVPTVRKPKRVDHRRRAASA